MKLMFLAATALSMTGTALAYQTIANDMDPEVAPTEATTTAPIAADPNAAPIDPVATAPAQPDLQTFAGMGGPYEEVYGSGNFSLTPRAAERNYPPCDPGPGDDQCIQLYERGVRDQLASWNRPTGGLFDESSTTAQGGPYEPAPSSATAHDTSAATGVHQPAPSPAAPEATTPSQPDPVGTTEDDTTEPYD